MRMTLVITLFLGCTFLVARAQSQQPVFEVASVKPLKVLPPGETGFGSVTQDPSMISIKSVNLRSLLRRAYGLESFRISGPDWLDTQCYDVMAKLPAGATADEIPALLQQLLTERFRMTLRWDTKQQTAYVLVVDKGGPRLTPSADQTTHDGDQPDKARFVSMSRTVRMGGAPIAALVSLLSNTLREPVIDSTGLKGRYDITLSLSIQDLAAALRGPSTSPDDTYTPSAIFEAVRYIGLRLDPQKTDVKYLIVVKADRIPAEN